MEPSAIATNRFGLGSRAGEQPDNPRSYLLDQFAQYDVRPAAIAATHDTQTMLKRIARNYEIRRENQRAEAAMSEDERDEKAAAMMEMSPQEQARARRMENRDGPAIRQDVVEAIGARFEVGLTSSAPFVERMVHFWSNHFAVSTDKNQIAGLAGPFEFETIRPHVLGKFGDMLAAVEAHPAMLVYLDQAQSVGPGSPAGLRTARRGRRQLGLNENLAREILELHTMGVRSGYSQADVIELAKALTGRTVVGLRGGVGPNQQGREPSVSFDIRRHEPGTRTVLGKRYADGGQRQAEDILADLATHPATARHVATKLARHFAGDNPSESLVARLEEAFLASGGDLPTVYRALIEAPEPWVPQPLKYRTPWEWSLASMRAVDVHPNNPRMAVNLLTQLGQTIWRPGSPAGFDDVAESWAGPDALFRRVEASNRIARLARDKDARALAPDLFPGSLSDETATALRQASSPDQALALLLVSPEMMRR